jgi:hypothetical protein
MKVTAKQLRKLADSLSPRYTTTVGASRELTKFAKLGFSNTQVYLRNPSRDALRISRELRKKGFRVFISGCGQWLDVEW